MWVLVRMDGRREERKVITKHRSGEAKSENLTESVKISAPRRQYSQSSHKLDSCSRPSYPPSSQTNLVNRKHLFDFHREGWTDVPFVVSRLGWLLTHIEDKVRALHPSPFLRFPPSFPIQSLPFSLPQFLAPSLNFLPGGDLRRFLGLALPA